MNWYKYNKDTGEILGQVGFMNSNDPDVIKTADEFVRPVVDISSTPHRVIEGPPVAPVVPARVDRVQAKRVLLQMGLLDQVNAAIAASGDLDLQIQWADSPTFARNNSTLCTFAKNVMGMTDEQLDNLFIAAAQL